MSASRQWSGSAGEIHKVSDVIAMRYAEHSFSPRSVSTLSISPNLQRFYISDISALLSNIILHMHLAVSMCFSICNGVVCHLLTPIIFCETKEM